MTRTSCGAGRCRYSINRMTASTLHTLSILSAKNWSVNSRKAEASKHIGTWSTTTTIGLTRHTWQRQRQVLAASIYYPRQQRHRMAPQLLPERKMQMSKQHRNRQLESHRDSGTVPQRNETADGSIVSEDVKPKPRVTTFVPKPCSACQRLRDLDPAIEGRSCSRVYSTQGRIRYCKCGFCGATTKEISD